MTCSPATPFSKLMIARCPEARRTGRSIQLRRTSSSILRSTSRGEVRQPDQEKVFADGHRQAGDRRAARAFLVLELQHAHVADDPPRLALPRREVELEGVRGRQGRVKVAPKQKVHRQPGLGKLDHRPAPPSRAAAPGQR